MSVKGIKVPSPGGAYVKRSQIPPVAMPRSVFDFSRGHKTSLDSGLIVPLLCEEILPGDTMRIKATILMRLATLLFPLMDNLYMDIHWFFCPMRLVWTNTEKFFGQQDNPADSVSYTIPQYTAGLTANVLGIADYFGINQYGTTARVFNTLQFRAYKRIWNEWYRDQNLQNSIVISYGDGPDSQVGQFDLLPRNKRADYFTMALPWPQKGATPVYIPQGTGLIQPVTPGSSFPTFRNAAGTTFGKQLQAKAAAATADIQSAAGTGNWAVNGILYWDSVGLALAPDALGTMNAFRQANAMQVYLERNARGGTRYPEYLKAQWGVTSSDARLQRTEFLGGASAPVVVSPIAQASSSLADNPLGKLGGVGSLSHHGAGIVKSFEEHGYLFCMVSVRADLNYQAGIPRQFKRRTVFDFANPAFAQIGEQPVYNYEIWYDGESSGNPTGTFGYQERFAEYKQSYSILTGNMRSQAAASYDVWHVAQEFAVLPTLGDTFIREVPAVDRVVATPFTDQWILDSVFEIKAARCLPLFGVPSLSMRF